jgi:hypothetical protein
MPRFVAAVAVVALMTVGVVALSSGYQSATSVNSVVNAGEQGGMHDLNINIFRNGANSGRLTMGQIDPRVRELGMEVLNMTVSGLRWAIFGFNSDETKIIPLTAMPASADWEKDFKMFTNGLPEEKAAVGVYNFEYWVDQDTTGVEPIMITWAPHCTILDDEVSLRRRRHCIGMDAREEAKAGYFLPNIIIALNSEEAQGRINTLKMKGHEKALEDNIGAQKKGYSPVPDVLMYSGPYRLDKISDSYYDFCTTEMGLPEKDCALEKGFHNCPFESEDEDAWTEANPCKQGVCAGDSFERVDGALPGTISQACCDYIEDQFCADPANYATPGCHAVTLAAIDQLCEIPNPPIDPIVEWTWTEEAQCKAKCADACLVISERGDPNDTWRSCEGCRMDMMPDENADNPGQISQCYPGAFGYEMNTCCGDAEDAEGAYFCQHEENLSAEVCNLLEYYDCKWIPQKDCPEEIKRQDIDKAPQGCCYMPGTEENYMTDSSFHYVYESHSWDMLSGEVDSDISEVLCGEGKYGEHDGSVFESGVHCDEVKARFEADKAAAEEAARLAALAAGTTTAAARV